MEFSIPFPFRVLSVENGRARIATCDEAPEVLPRLIARTDAPARLAICLRTFDSEVKRRGIRPVAGKPIRYREIDLLPLATPQAVLPTVIPLPKPVTKSTSASAPRVRKVRLSV